MGPVNINKSPNFNLSLSTCLPSLPCEDADLDNLYPKCPYTYLVNPEHLQKSIVLFLFILVITLFYSNLKSNKYKYV